MVLKEIERTFLVKNTDFIAQALTLQERYVYASKGKKATSLSKERVKRMVLADSNGRKKLPLPMYMPYCPYVSPPLLRKPAMRYG